MAGTISVMAPGPSMMSTLNFLPMRRPSGSCARHPIRPMVRAPPRACFCLRNSPSRVCAFSTGLPRTAQVGVSVVFDEGIADPRQLRLNGMGVVFVHLTAEGDDVRSHGLLPNMKINSASYHRGLTACQYLKHSCSR